MKEWYSNQKVGIFFDDIPHVCIRYYIPSMSEEDKKSIEKYRTFCPKSIAKFAIFPMFCA